MPQAFIVSNQQLESDLFLQLPLGTISSVVGNLVLNIVLFYFILFLVCFFFFGLREEILVSESKQVIFVVVVSTHYSSGRMHFQVWR